MPSYEHSICNLYPIPSQVAEHIPPSGEMAFVRNLHAHNCLGIVLSWADYSGHAHVNRRGDRADDPLMTDEKTDG
jgi:hypothetical protein